MYKVIGGDGRQYGPITDMEMRQWIGEGRLSAQSMARAEGDAEFRPLSTFPEFADALGSAAPVSEGAASRAPAVDWSDRDYELDIGGCISQGWNLFKNNLGILLGSVVLYLLILVVLAGISNAVLIAIIPKTMFLSVAFKIGFNIFYQVVFALIAGPLTGGLYYLFIRTIRGQSAGVGDLFAGFQKMYLQLYLGYFTVTFLTGLCLIPFTFAESSRLEPVLEHFQHSPTPDQMQGLMSQLGVALGGILPILLVCLVPMIYLMVNFQFTLPLIIDKGMGFGAALMASWKRVHKHWLTVFGLFIVTTLIFIAGCFVCCIGAFFTLPISTAALMFAYETIFGQERASSNL